MNPGMAPGFRLLVIAYGLLAERVSSMCCHKQRPTCRRRGWAVQPLHRRRCGRLPSGWLHRRRRVPVSVVGVAVRPRLGTLVSGCRS